MLSQDGKDFLPFAAEMIRLEDLYKSSCNDTNNEISVCYPKEMQPYNVSGLFQRFVTENPDITIKFIGGDELLQAIEDNKCDCFFHEPHFVEDFPQYKTSYQMATPAFLRDRLSVVVPANHPLAQKGQVSLKELAGERLFARQSVLNRESLRKAFLAEGLDLPNVSFQSRYNYIELVFLQRGLVIMSKRVADYYVKNSNIHAAVLDLQPEFAVNDVVFYRKGRLSLAERRFLEYILSLTEADVDQ